MRGPRHNSGLTKARADTLYAGLAATSNTFTPSAALVTNGDANTDAGFNIHGSFRDWQLWTPTADSQNACLASFYIEIEDSSHPVNVARGFTAYVDNFSSQAVNYIYVADYEAFHDGTGSVGEMAGVICSASVDTAATVGNMFGAILEAGSAASGSTVTQMAAAHVTAPHTTGATVGLLAGFLMEDQSGASGSGYAVYSKGGRVYWSGQTGFGTDAPGASAQVQIDSTTKGFLPPRMTTTQRDAVSSPATGLEIYNTTTGRPEVYNGSAWVAEGQGAQDDAGLILAGQIFGA